MPDAGTLGELAFGDAQQPQVRTHRDRIANLHDPSFRPALTIADLSDVCVFVRRACARRVADSARWLRRVFFTNLEDQV
jgi:hypothetical protein